MNLYCINEEVLEVLEVRWRLVGIVGLCAQKPCAVQWRADDKEGDATCVLYISIYIYIYIL